MNLSCWLQVSPAGEIDLKKNKIIITHSKSAQGLEALLQCICAALAFRATADNIFHHIQSQGSF